MSKAKKHKFQGKFETTYYEYFRDTYLEGVELAKELIDNLGREKAFEIIKKASDKQAIETAKAITKMTPIKSLGGLVALMKKYHESRFFKSAQTIAIVKDSPEEFTYRITECIWAKTFNDLNAEDIGCAMVCRRDPIIAAALNKNLRLKRKGLIMQGDRYCDFSYTWKD
jgi:hypothetical protein